jgi:RNA polymerase sigma-70 factor (ECF subfamily)
MGGTGFPGDGSPVVPSRLSEFSQSRLHAQASEPETASDEFEAMLLDIVSSAQRAYPTFSLPPDAFVAYLLERIPAGVSWPLALRQMHSSDLYLACACARGDVSAFAAFDDRCLRHLDRVLGTMGIDADVSADVKQDIRHLVLVGDGRRAKILDFSGRGDLRGWVRVMAVRQALRRRGHAQREVPMEDDELLQRIAASSDPALDHVKEIYRQEFQRAFRGALQALPDRERTLLRQAYIDGLTVDALGNLYRVHRATAARLLARARGLLLESTRAQMMSQLDVQPQELDSIMRLIWSQIEISLRDLRRRRKR